MSHASVSLSHDVMTVRGLPSVYFNVELSINIYGNSLTFKEPKMTLFEQISFWFFTSLGFALD